MLLFLALFLESKYPINLFYMTIGLIVLIFGFFTKGKNINLTFSFFIALIGANIIQWLILLYIYYYNPIYLKTGFYEYLVILFIIIITLININHRNKLNAHETGENRKNKLLEDKTKLILLLTGIILIIGCLWAFIVYYAPILLYIATFGLLAFIYGYYHENKKLNVSNNYIKAMGIVFILQYIILGVFSNQISKDDFIHAVTFSLLNNIYFLVMTPNDALFNAFLYSKKKKEIISNEKKEKIIGIFGIILFIAIFGAYLIIGAGSQIGHAKTNITGNISDYSVADTSYINSNISTKTFSANGINFNYPINWYVHPEGSLIIASKDYGDGHTQFQAQTINNNGTSVENIIKKYQENITPGWTKIANYKITIDNKTAYEDVYTSKENPYNTFMKFTRIILIKNDKTYLMFLQAPDKDFDAEKANFAVILNSFKVQ